MTDEQEHPANDYVEPAEEREAEAELSEVEKAMGRKITVGEARRMRLKELDQLCQANDVYKNLPNNRKRAFLEGLRKSLSDRRLTVPGYFKPHAPARASQKAGLCEICGEFGANATVLKKRVCWQKQCRAEAQE